MIWICGCWLATAKSDPVLPRRGLVVDEVLETLLLADTLVEKLLGRGQLRAEFVHLGRIRGRDLGLQAADSGPQLRNRPPVALLVAASFVPVGSVAWHCRPPQQSRR